MSQFIFKDKVVNYELFIPKQKNYFKLNIRGIEFNEGIWACMNPDDVEDYENDVEDDKVRVAVLANAPLLYPLEWGTYVPYKMNGKERPIDLINELDDTNKFEVYRGDIE